MGKHIPPQELEAARRTRPLRHRVLFVAGLVLVGIASVLVGYAALKHRNPVEAITALFIPAPQQVFGASNLLVLVEGLDYDYNQSDVESSAHSRSDVIWAVNLDFANKRIFQLSIPRDMIATLPNGTQAKINEAQSDGGPKEAKAVIASWLGIPAFNRYMVLRIDASKDLIDAIGGVDLYVKNSDCLRYHTDCTGGSIDYDDSWGHLHIHLKEGMQHLNGDNGVAYMRFRHDWCSDPCRIMRQQELARAIIDKLKGNKLNTLMHAGTLVAIFRKDVQTDFSDKELISLANFYADMPPANFKTAQVPYTADIDLPDYGDSLVPDQVARAQLVQSMLIAPPVPQPSPGIIAMAAILPGTVRVDVENGSGVLGAAHRVAERLRKAGFKIGDVGDAPGDEHATSEIHEHSATTFAGAKVREALAPEFAYIPVLSDATAPASAAASPNGGVPPGATGSDVTVIVGKDLATGKPAATTAAVLP